MKVYHIANSQARHFIKENGMKLIPRIPLFRSKNEDEITPRICVCKSIGKALGAREGIDSYYKFNKKLDNFGRITDYLIEIEIDKSKLYKPTLKEVSDSKHTGELWIKEEIIINSFKPIYLCGGQWNWVDRKFFELNPNYGD